jgi:hypothetical protein
MTRTDQQLISEAYSAVSFKQTLPNMSLKVLRENVYNLNTAELTETTEVINELFGGLRNVFSGVKNTAAAAGGAIKNAAVNAGGAIKNAAVNAGSAVAAGAKQLGSNVANMYNTGQQQAAATQQQKQAKDSVDKLIGILDKLKNDPSFKQFSTRSGNTKDLQLLTLKQIQAILTQAVGQATQSAQGAAQQGIFGGVGQAAAQAYNPQQQPVAQPVAQPAP